MPVTSTPASAIAMPVGLRERKKRRTRLRIIEAALDLCDAQGFDATTIDEIADAVGVSPRTVNRYFPGKEDIVLGPSEDFGVAVAERLQVLPVTGNELEALCEACVTVFDEVLRDIDGPLSLRQFHQMERILRRTPTVRARSMDLSGAQNAALAQTVAARLRTTPDALQVRAVIGAGQLIGQLSLEGIASATAIPGKTDTDITSVRAAAVAVYSACYEEVARTCGSSPAGA